MVSACHGPRAPINMAISRFTSFHFSNSFGLFPLFFFSLFFHFLSDSAVLQTGFLFPSFEFSEIVFFVDLFGGETLDWRTRIDLIFWFDFPVVISSGSVHRGVVDTEVLKSGDSVLYFCVVCGAGGETEKAGCQ